MTTCYLETSAVNRLVDDQSRSGQLGLPRGDTRIYISVFTVAELAACGNRQRRAGLLDVARELLGGYRPLAMPGDLLRSSLEAMQEGKRVMNASIGAEWNGVWSVLCDPSQIDDEAHSEVLAWKRQQEEWYHAMHARGRPHMQRTLAKLPVEQQKKIKERFSGLIRHYDLRPDFVYDFFCDVASSAMHTVVTRELVERLITHSEHWRFFMAGMAYGVHARSVRGASFSRAKTPGSIDTQQAVYLATCDTFVTADNGQYQMMRLVAPFGHRRRRVWKYDQFRRWIGESTGE